jgi:hypothetical protein
VVHQNDLGKMVFLFIFHLFPTVQLSRNWGAWLLRFFSSENKKRSCGLTVENVFFFAQCNSQKINKCTCTKGPDCWECSFFGPVPHLPPRGYDLIITTQFHHHAREIWQTGNNRSLLLFILLCTSFCIYGKRVIVGLFCFCTRSLSFYTRSLLTRDSCYQDYKD